MNLRERLVEALDRLNPCDACLGRAFGYRLTGLENRERGRALKLTLGMLAHEEGDEGTLELLARSGLEEAAAALEDPPSPEPCGVCGGVLERCGEFARVAALELEGMDFDGFVIGSRWPDRVLDRERELWDVLGVEGEPIKREFNREVGKRVERLLGERADPRDPDAELIFDFRPSLDDPKLELHVKPVYVRGRYLKLRRGLPQTKWPCPRCRGAGCPECDYTGKVYPESVEELIGMVLKDAFLAEHHRFHAAGREDIDVRMLGNGRPFVIELLYPKRRTADLRRLEREIERRVGDKVRVRGLEFGEAGDVRRVKDLSERSLKRYRAWVVFDREVPGNRLREALEALTGREIRQRTPRRVLHRRADKVRVKRVHEARLVRHEGDEAVVEFLCDPGLYVKELISGDAGRTRPSLSELVGARAECERLDVIEFLDEGEWS
ncbi:tRNA pseudouridine(54/55) synthase Pus10 [Methanopyrus sp.]